MKAADIRQKYLDFFVKRGHKIIAPAPLVPENDPTTLFTSSGMQQLVPYLKGEPHPMGKRLVDSQPSLRLQDIEEVGDTSHTTFFEMLGNWSLGGYFKKEQLPWFWEFLTKELRLAKEKLYVSVFDPSASLGTRGEGIIPKDDESYEVWKSLGIPEEHIFFYGVDKNWWSRSGPPQDMPPGEIGGPDSEVFYDFGENLHLHENSRYKNEKCHPNCQCGRFLEIGNSVFIQYEKKEGGTLSELPQKNVDFGGGLERLAAATNNDPDVFKIDLFSPIIKIIEQVSGENYEGNEKAMRIIADHLRAATFLINADIEPSNKAQGYILRRLIRRSVIKMKDLTNNIRTEDFLKICDQIISLYKSDFPLNKEKTRTIVENEISKFLKTLNKGLREIESHLKKFDTHGGWLDTPENAAKFAFYLYETYGLPMDTYFDDLLKKFGVVYAWGQKEDLYKEFEKLREKHQELSRTASAGMFKGGLANHSEEVTKLHTATHLLHAALRKVLGEQVQQKGSNITAERLRFDFLHPQKPTEEEIEKVEELVNQKIRENLPVTMEVMDLKAAQKSGALSFFTEKYGDKVKVYSVADFSKEVCGGPHVDFTGSLGRFKIIKEESVSSGVRRIYATLTPD